MCHFCRYFPLPSSNFRVIYYIVLMICLGRLSLSTCCIPVCYLINTPILHSPNLWTYRIRLSSSTYSNIFVFTSNLIIFTLSLCSFQFNPPHLFLPRSASVIRITCRYSLLMTQTSAYSIVQYFTAVSIISLFVFLEMLHLNMLNFCKVITEWKRL